MGFSAGGGGTKNVRSEINVTPLVDVVLVLLIIFLVAMPVLMKEITVEVPAKVDENVPVERASNQLVIEWKDDGRLLLDGQEVLRTDLATKVRAKLEKRLEKDRVVFVDFDDSIRYRDVVSVMDTVKGAGASTVALKMKEDPRAPSSGSPQAE